MTTDKDGGPAFPIPNDKWNMAGDAGWDAAPGMSLRDWFAGRAPQHRAEFPSPESAAAFVGMDLPSEGDMEGLALMAATIQAKLAYIYADAMLAARALPAKDSAP